MWIQTESLKIFVDKLENINTFDRNKITTILINKS